MVYFTPMIPNLYVLRCRQLDGGIKLLEYFDMFKKWQILVGRWQNFQNALAFMANMSNRKRNSRNFLFDNT